MDAYDRCTNLGGKNLADIIAIYGRGQELLRPPRLVQQKFTDVTYPETAGNKCLRNYGDPLHDPRLGLYISTF